MTGKEVEACTRSSWPDEIRQLESFDNNSWGSAYQTIAEVQLVLRIGKKYRMTTNYARCRVSVGLFIDRNGEERGIKFEHLGSYLNGQSAGTWANKLTFFFSVYHFLVKTEGVGEEKLGPTIFEVRRAVASWGISSEAEGDFLSRGDNKASLLITPTRKTIRQYMRGEV